VCKVDLTRKSLYADFSILVILTLQGIFHCTSYKKIQISTPLFPLAFGRDRFQPRKNKSKECRQLFYVLYLLNSPKIDDHSPKIDDHSSHMCRN